MNCKADTHYMNVYAAEIDKVLARMQKASPVDKMNIRRMVSDLTWNYGRMMFDLAAMIAMITLVEDFGFGTGANATKMPRFVATFQERLDDYTDRMGESAPQHARNKLKEKGIDYKMHETPWVKEGWKR